MAAQNMRPMKTAAPKKADEPWTRARLLQQAPPKNPPPYVPHPAWIWYEIWLKPEERITLKNVPFKDLARPKQLKLLKDIEAIVERFFFSDASEALWKLWPSHYPAHKTIALCEFIFLAAGQFEVFREGMAYSSRAKSKENLVKLTQKLRSAIRSESFIFGLKSYCEEAKLLEALEAFEFFLADATYNYDPPMAMDPFHVALAYTLSFRRTVKSVDFLRFLSTILPEAKIDVSPHFLQAALECFYPASEDESYTLEYVKRYIRPRQSKTRSS